MLDRDFTRAKVALLNALADETRLQILDYLQRRREATVSEILKHVGREQSAISHHLACLRSCGLVSTRRRGRNIQYSLNGKDRVGKILDLADRHVSEVLEGILACREVGE
ncbi:MAG: winged helix-turn-helix transcriptional regulator [Euryarchaeota archaeon]|nr:winged helix-turn-helix transcriptional regulator [Euryarchaeota archaeon]